MSITSPRRIQVAREFVRLGFGDVIDHDAPFYSHDFLTQVLTTTEVQAVIPVVANYNGFDGNKVAQAIGRFKGRVDGWQFGSAGSPLLVAVLAYWTHQVEDTPPRTPSGRRFTDEERAALVNELREVFLNELGADKFEQDPSTESKFGAWWD
jgi:hypothetical protein